MKNLRFLTIFLIVASFFPGCAPQKPPAEPGNSVHITHEGKNYQLFLNNQPFYIQGVGVGMAFGKKGENYLALAKELGANAVRTWGVEQGDQAYLDEAHRQGLYVAAGVWLNYVDDSKIVSYISDPNYLAKKDAETLDYVRRFKDHPAVLLWNVGNEVINFTKSEDERVAFCRYLESLVQKVHQLDPNHPVIYAAAGTSELPYLRKYVPSLDAVGVNIYGDVLLAHIQWETLGFEAPYLLTEFGPTGPWNLPRDSNGKLMERSDFAKSADYRNSWNMLYDHRGFNIGGFAFHLGETTQDSLTFWNLNHHQWKKEPFLLMQKIFKKAEVPEHAPRITSFLGVPAEIAHNAAFTVELAATDPQGEALEYGYTASTSVEGVLEYYANSEIPIRVEGEGSRVTLYAPSEPGIYRIYGTVKNARGNAASVNASLKVI